MEFPKMCGIAGVLNFEVERPVGRDVVESMANALRHRGPDDFGIHIDGNVGLGFRRLAILDLSDAGNQPIANEDQTIWATTNGEIYNYRELADGLRKRGHRFRSQSDTEVVVHLYEEHGPALVHHLRGMFAIALWDARSRALMLARDRLGKKPLCYFQGAHFLAYASELSAVVQHPSVPREIDLRALDQFLCFGYVPAPRTAFAGVKKLPPAHYLICDDRGVRMERYWRPRFAPKSSIKIDDAAEELRAHLREAVRLRLVSDVPLGVLLSGGIDSSLVLALASESTDRIRTFSIGFEQPEFDELPFARRVARHFGADHSEYVVRPDALGVIGDLVSHYGEPYADTSCIPTYYVAKLAGADVTVVLNGDGGDENFAGYGRYLSRRLLGRLYELPFPVRRGVATMSRALSDVGGPWADRARVLSAVADRPLADRYADMMTVPFFPDALRRAVYSNDMQETMSPAAAYVSPIMAEADSEDTIDRVLFTELCTVLPGDLLTKMDIATMAHGVEARSPFLDQRVVEFAARLPTAFKQDGGEQKVLLRRMAKGLLPDEVLTRAKQGFAVPLEDWFRGDLGDLARDVLLDQTARQRGYFHHDRVSMLLSQHASGRANNDYRLWCLLFFELWHRQFLDRNRRSTAARPV